MKPTLAFDMEVYWNYTLLLFKNVETKVVYEFEHHGESGFGPEERNAIRSLVKNHRIVTFNGVGYDMNLLMYVLKGATVEQTKQASDRIIVHGLKYWNFEKEFSVKVTDPNLDHIDLMEVAPLKGSLKMYAAKMHSRSIQELPIPPASLITEGQLPLMRTYCENDLNSTTDLFYRLQEPLALREQMSKDYGIDLRSKSDAQIAEAVIKSEVEKMTGMQLAKPLILPGTEFTYQIPSWMSFRHLDLLNDISVAKFSLSDKQALIMPAALKSKKIEIGTGVYRMGIGGLHSSEKKQVRLATDTHMIIDFDVTGYYPSIILNERLFPKHIGPAFLEVFRSIVARRLAAKRAKNKSVAESLKITANGSFGKLGSKWSLLFAPDLMIQVTVTGQLALLMLIEMLWDIPEVEVISANTDGVTVRCPRDREVSVVAVTKEWEMITEFDLERADYHALYNRDVNGYIAVKTDGEVKTKGPYGRGLPLHGNPHGHICAQAVIDYLTLDFPIEGTVNACRDIREFIYARKVTGGATWHGEEIGKVVRWVYSKNEKEALLYKDNGHLVPDTYGALPLVVLPRECPDELDRDWYITNAYSMLNNLGVDE